LKRSARQEFRLPGDPKKPGWLRFIGFWLPVAAVICVDEVL